VAHGLLLVVSLRLPQIPTQRDDAARPPRAAWLSVFIAFWLVSVVAGVWQVMAYENRPGPGASAPQSWPAASRLALAGNRPTLVLVAHPQCPCTRASMAELAEILARTDYRPQTYILFLRPAGFADGWEKTDLWQGAAKLPGVTLVRDDGGVEARRFGAETSGQTLLYDARGRLVFSGGITGSRGHVGDNAGQSALIDLLSRGGADRPGTSVFGCPLFAQGT
jgi:hypothetical protein